MTVLAGGSTVTGRLEELCGPEEAAQDPPFVGPGLEQHRARRAAESLPGSQRVWSRLQVSAARGPTAPEQQPPSDSPSPTPSGR